MAAPKQLLTLLERFTSNRSSYVAAKYNETQTRIEFVDPFFRCMGWDMDNERGYAEAYKSVIHEDALKIGRSTKAPDYSFRIGSERKFFVETKKPSVNIKEDAAPAFQLRRYGWSAKLQVSILTNFEGLAVYDCRVKPNKNDRASVARLMYISHDEYAERWNEIEGIFSEQSILAGSFDKYAVSEKARRGTSEVDDEFLKELDKWRSALAVDIATQNSTISEAELNYAVQLLIDRIVFLRISEDRGIERYESLKEVTQSGGVYDRLKELFERADRKYNSGLFHFSSADSRSEPHDSLTPGLNINDSTLNDIIGNLYYPECPYEFSIISADILGKVYEQFLGQVIRLLPNGEAKIEERPEVKKAGGVFYTPPYIVRRILNQTVGALLVGAEPHLVAGRTKKTWKIAKNSDPVTVIDPACGSGSFLLGAYQFLLDWYLDSYLSAGPANHPSQLDRTGEGVWRLSSSERKRILLDHIYGVDIDARAVEVTKLSLLLKVLEGENIRSLEHQLDLLTERALPDLGNNIRCGDSLVGIDILNAPFSISDTDYFLHSVNAFDWASEFPKATRQGGFDVVVGNPPYIDSEWMTRYLGETRKYCAKHYDSASGNWDMYCVFAEKALELCKSDGRASMIVPNKLGSADYASAARRILTQQNTLESITDYSKVSVFPVSVYPIIFNVVKKRPSDEDETFSYLRMASELEIEYQRQLSYSQYLSDPNSPWRIFGATTGTHLVERLTTCETLGNWLEITGAATVSEAYEIKELIEDSNDPSGSALKLINSGTIDPHQSLWGVKPCRYLKTSYKMPILNKENEAKLPPKRGEQARSPKIIVAGMTKQLECVADTRGEYLAGKSTTIICGTEELYYVLGVLSSKLISIYYEAVFGANKLSGGYLRVGPPQIKNIPCPRPKEENAQLRESISSHTKNIVEAKLRLPELRTPLERTTISRKLAIEMEVVDRLVYQLFNVTEIESVEMQTALKQTALNS